MSARGSAVCASRCYGSRAPPPRPRACRRYRERVSRSGRPRGHIVSTDPCLVVAESNREPSRRRRAPFSRPVARGEVDGGVDREGRHAPKGEKSETEVPRIGDRIARRVTLARPISRPLAPRRPPLSSSVTVAVAVAAPRSIRRPPFVRDALRPSIRRPPYLATSDGGDGGGACNLLFSRGALLHRAPSTQPC